jgi:UDP-N-acetyl-D-mannosaminuronic acid dehydrogenase
VQITVIGGCGHVGLPLAIALADTGQTVLSYDISAEAVRTVNSGLMPFREDGADEVLTRVLAADRFKATTDPASVSTADVVIVVIGTPVDEHLNPDPTAIRFALEECLDHFRDGQLVALRSTIYPGVTSMVNEMFRSRGLDIDVAFCPERIAEGFAMTELYSLPQIVAGVTSRATDRAAELFSVLAPEIVRMEPEEAEMAKLFTNAWRYIKFATANQFYMMANERGLDFERIRSGLAHNYPRATDLPRAGFAAGPCLFKDTMQLAAFSDNAFGLGHAAMLVNEGLPLYVVSKVEERFDLPNSVVGILGMAFKADSDDTRSSLSYKLRRLLRFRAKGVVCTDPYVSSDPSLIPFDQAMEEADLLIVGAPHAQYRDFSTSKPVVDIWNVRNSGIRI